MTEFTAYSNNCYLNFEQQYSELLRAEPKIPFIEPGGSTSQSYALKTILPPTLVITGAPFSVKPLNKEINVGLDMTFYILALLLPHK
jgi:hypothetical protein